MNNNLLISYIYFVSAVFAMSNKFEEGICITFGVELDKSATKTFVIIKKAFENYVMSRFKTSE